MEIREVVVVPPVGGMTPEAVTGQLRMGLGFVNEARDRKPICQLDGYAWGSAHAINAMALQITWLAGGDGGHRTAYGELPLARVPSGNFRVTVPEGAEGAEALSLAAETIMEELLTEPSSLRALQSAACRSEVLPITRELAALTAGIPIGGDKH